MAGLTAMFLVGIVTSPASAKKNDNQPLNWFGPPDTVESGEVGTGAHTSLQRSADSVSVGVHARQLEPGHAYTVWLVIFNNPGLCVDGCDVNDVSPTNGNSAVIWSGVGGVANGGGNLNGTGYLTEGNPQGYEALFGTFGNAEAAEIHMVVRDHGPYVPGTNQTNTLLGNCSNGGGTGTFPCNDVQFSIHMA